MHNTLVLHLTWQHFNVGEIVMLIFRPSLSSSFPIHHLFNESSSSSFLHCLHFHSSTRETVEELIGWHISGQECMMKEGKERECEVPTYS